MRKATCLLGALGLVTLVGGCVQESGYPNTAYAPNGYGYNYPSQQQSIGQALGGVFNQSNAQPTYYGQPFAQQGYYGQQQGYYQQPQYYGPRRW